jgi:hypothetical protein
MTDKPENQVTANTQPVYDPPQALRMGDIHAGAGGITCGQPGSGDTGYCSTGNSAQGDGCSPGNAASVCAAAGSGAGVTPDD